jgi:superfamily II DNA helicase RecQ
MRSEPANTHMVGIPLEKCQPYIRAKLTNPVLLSPEIVLSERFKTKVLYDQAFRDHLVLVAIDELHVVSDWGQHWRNSYSRLTLLRDLIDRPVP